MLGNTAMMDGTGDTGEPFVVAESPTDGAVFITPFDGSTGLTISIRGNGETVHKMDEKYLPNVPVTVTVTDFDAITGQIKVSHTSNELEPLWMTKMIFMNIDGSPLALTSVRKGDEEGDDEVKAIFVDLFDHSITAEVDRNGFCTLKLIETETSE